MWELFQFCRKWRLPIRSGYKRLKRAFQISERLQFKTVPLHSHKKREFFNVSHSFGISWASIHYFLRRRKLCSWSDVFSAQHQGNLYQRRGANCPGLWHSVTSSTGENQFYQLAIHIFSIVTVPPSKSVLSVSLELSRISTQLSQIQAHYYNYRTLI